MSCKIIILFFFTVLCLIRDVYMDTTITPIYIAKTIDGKFCAIPFVYEGKTYHDCIPQENRSWCSLDKVYISGKSEWNYCVPHPKEFEKCTLAHPNITLEEVEVILREHNLARAKLPALRMRKMEWNSELAMKAQVAANKCLQEHTESILCGERYKTGQNLYYNYLKYDYPNQVPWPNVINYWSREKKDYDFATKSCTKGMLCGHYTQVAWAKSGQIGCGKAYCHGTFQGNKNDIQYSIQYMCNYFESGNFPNTDPYTESKTEKCQDCWKFEPERKFRCDKDQLCEACQNDMENCLGLEEIKVLSAEGKICSDTSQHCDINAKLCDLEKNNGWVHPQIKLFLKDCNKTCKRC